MGGKVRLEFNYEAFNELRRSVQDEISARAHAIASAAGDGFGVTHDEPTATRARAIVGTATPEGRRAQARDDILTQALGAGRG